MHHAFSARGGAGRRASSLQTSTPSPPDQAHRPSLKHHGPLVLASGVAGFLVNPPTRFIYSCGIVYRWSLLLHIVTENPENGGIDFWSERRSASKYPS